MKRTLLLPSFLCVLITQSAVATITPHSDSPYFRPYSLSKKTKITLMVIASVVGLFGIPMGIYLYKNHQWQGPIEAILPKLAKKFEFDLDALDQDAYRDYREKLGFNSERKLDIELIKLSVIGDEEVFNHRIRALTRPQAAKAAYFIAYKRGHSAFAEKLRKACRREFLFEEDFNPFFM